MKRTSQTPITYKREKNKVEISGDPADVKRPMWFDLISSRLLWLVPLAWLLWKLPEVSWLPVVMKWLKHKLYLMILIAVQGSCILLSLSG